MPPLVAPTIVQVHQILASRDVSPQVTETCLAQGLDINRLGYIKWLVANGRLNG